MRSRSVPEGIASRLLRELEEEKTWKTKFEAHPKQKCDRIGCLQADRKIEKVRLAMTCCNQFTRNPLIRCQTFRL